MSDLSRRTVIAAAATAVTVGGSVAGTAAPASGVATRARRALQRTFTRDPGLYTRRRFSRLVGKRFTLSRGGVSWTVVLRSVDDLPSGAAAGGFALSFRSTTDAPAQETYTLRRRGFETTSLFVVPGSEQRTCVAVVNGAGPQG